MDLNTLWIVYKYDKRTSNLMAIFKKLNDEILSKLFPLNVFNLGFKVYPSIRRLLHPNKQMRDDGNKIKRYSTVNPGNYKCNNKGCKLCKNIQHNKKYFTSNTYGTKYKNGYNCVYNVKYVSQYVGSSLQNTFSF